MVSSAFKSPRTDAKTMITANVTPPPMVARIHGNHLPPKKSEIPPKTIRTTPTIHGYLLRKSTIAVA